MTSFIAALAAGLLAVLFVHELGHLVAARHYGVKVRSLSVGFGPEIVGFSDRTGTRWKLKAFPLGGFCVLSNDYFPAQLPSENTTTSEATLLRSSWRQRAMILAAGPSFNLVFALILYTVTLTWCRECELDVLGNQAGWSIWILFRLICALSAATGLLNLLPFLPLDGGWICLVAVEAIRGRSFSKPAKKYLLAFSLTIFLTINLGFFIWVCVNMGSLPGSV
jgi:membrane-associated protease RseP (regulator of RpoE activity)